MIQRIVTALALAALAAGSTGCVTALVAPFQPENLGGETVVITTTDADGESHDRVVTPIDDGDQLLVSANHWPRAWYHEALANPNVRVTRGGETKDYTAVPVSEEEHERLQEEQPHPILFTILTGFAPREFLKLEPR